MAAEWERDREDDSPVVGMVTKASQMERTAAGQTSFFAADGEDCGGCEVGVEDALARPGDAAQQLHAHALKLLDGLNAFDLGQGQAFIKRRRPGGRFLQRQNPTGAF